MNWTCVPLARAVKGNESKDICHGGGKSVLEASKPEAKLSVFVASLSTMSGCHPKDLRKIHRDVTQIDALNVHQFLASFDLYHKIDSSVFGVLEQPKPIPQPCLPH